MSNFILAQATAPTAPVTTTATTTVPQPTPTAQPQQESGWTSMLLMIGIVFAALYFFIIRPQKKQADTRKQMLEAIKAGDKVTTIGGMMGTIINVTEEKYTLEIANGVKIDIAKFGVADVAKTQEVK